LSIKKGGENMILLNFSGHPAPRGTEEMDVVDIPPVIANPTPAEINKKVQALVDQVCEDKNVKEAIARGEYQVLLPGYSPLATALMAELAGRTGRLPTVRWGIRRREKFYISSPCQLQAQRTAARVRRMEEMSE
jgi:hypothetical protein